MGSADLQEKFAAVPTYVEHSPMPTEVITLDADARFVARQRGREAHPPPRHLIAFAAAVKTSAVHNHLLQTSLAHEPSRVAQEHRESLQKVRRNDIRKIDLRLQQVAIF